MKSRVNRNNFFVVLVCMAVVFLSAETAKCRTITVQADGNGDYPTIQDAIDDSNDGDVIVCADGTYTGDGNCDIDFLGKAITVRSENGPENCIIDCNGTTAEPHRGFYFHSGESPASILSGFTIKRGKIYGSSAKGGGIYCNNSSPKIENCIIADNTAHSEVDTHAYGGGIHISSNSNSIIENCIISGNRVIGGVGKEGNYYGCDGRCAHGGGIYCGGSGRINKCQIYNNQAIGGMGGHGFFKGGPGGGAYGAGICCRSDSVTISNCLISGNPTIGGKGGSGYSDWRSDGGPAYGGGLFLHLDAESVINNCVVTGNEVKGGERGEGQYGGSIGGAYGAGIKGGTSETKIQNCIIRDNRGDKEIATSGEVTYSNVKGGYSGVGNINADPLFIDAGFWDANGIWVEGDYHFLWPESPCVDTGDPDYVIGPNETDLDGNPRVIGTRIDMGAYEFTGADLPEVVALAITGPEKVCEYSSAQYKVIVYYDDGCTRDVTTSKWAVWSLEPQNCGSIDKGLLITQDIETAEHITISAQYSSAGVIIDAEMIVSVAVPIGLEIKGPQVVHDNFQIQYKSVVYYDNNQTNDVTHGTIWEVEPQAVADIDANGLLHTKEINEPQAITLYGQYTAANVTVQADLVVEVYLCIHVPEEYETIQAAINDAVDGDTIIVAPGTYTGLGNRDIDFLGKVITVRSIDPNDPNIVAATVIDCNATPYDRHRSFKFHSGEDADSILKGLTIKNGYAHDGGGIYCSNSSSPTIANCTITGNTASDGGAIYCAQSSPTIKDCTITGNSASYGGGGIYCGSATVTNCTISGNSARYGGGIYCGNATITNCIISDNRSYRNGGGIVCGDATITNCIIRGNSAEGDYGDGGGIYFRHDTNPMIANCAITDNKAEGYGGGIFGGWFAGTAIINCTITGNTACNGGGLAYCDCPITNCIITGNWAGNCSWGGNGGGLFECNGPITNCTIAGNRAHERGGGMSNCEGPINNCIIWGNRSEQIYTSGSVTYSNVQGGWEGEGNIDAEPLFALDTDYHLMPDSPCIDVGTNDPCGGLPATDIEAVPRPLDGDGDANAVADMGAYEYTADSPSIAVSAHSFYFVQNWPRPESQTLQIRNCGGQPLHWEIVEDCNWLEAAPANGVSAGQISEVTITVDPNGLAPGLYIYDFRVEDSNASNSPVTVRVTMPVGTVLGVPSPVYPTIQAAIDAADNYDIVLVADGNYTGDGNKNLDFRGKPITVCSENGPNNCTIDCEKSGHGFYFHTEEKEDSLVDGFSITNGGAGIYCEEGSPTINNCNIFENNGGILCMYESSPKIANCTITDNGSDHGITYGGFWPYSMITPTVTNCTISNNGRCGILFDWRGVLTVTDCTISNNTGTGISCRQGDLVAANCRISGNSWRGAGGGIYCGGSSTITNCTITGNSAGWGGGIDCFGYYGGGATTIDNCTITSNYAYSGFGGIGGHRGNLTMTNCVIAGNSAGEGISGIYWWDGSLSLTNCTITGNAQQSELYAAVSAWDSNLTITNCILWGNEAPNLYEIFVAWGTNASVSYTEIEGGRDSVYVGSDCSLDWGEGNIDEEPCFVVPGYWADINDPNIIVEPNDPNAAWVEGDYHLLEISPCIDSGDPNYVARPNETDLEGNPRIMGSAIDMGAYEYNPPVAAEVGIEPDTLNLQSKGVITAFIELPEPYSVEDIEPDSLLCQGAGAIRTIIAGDILIVKFGREELQELQADEEVELLVSGELADGTVFEGTDVIRVIDKGGKKKN